MKSFSLSERKRAPAGEARWRAAIRSRDHRRAGSTAAESPATPPGRGLSVYLCEQADLASGTSSAATKLIHGGLRYLEYYEFRLVREALMEREVLWRIAPHIIWPLRFVLPYHEGLRPRVAAALSGFSSMTISAAANCCRRRARSTWRPTLPARR